ncbi:MAG: SDR family oxidoreductase [Spirochaetia bacterium]|nr:SDR family oxidoreductase [Spirochaetia bacterium]
MKVLVLGASGSTGTQVVKQLIRRSVPARILIRERATICVDIRENPLVETITGNINELDRQEMSDLMSGCDLIISCLGHTISFKGMFGEPRNLVVDAMRSIKEAVEDPASSTIKLILMSTTAYTNTAAGEKSSFGERIVYSLLMRLLPPHRDNMLAANLLIHEIGTQDAGIAWVAVRPDTLIDRDAESPYEVVGSPERSPVFNAGKTSRINVGHFMAELATDDALWQQWVYKTPVIYNR